MSTHTLKLVMHGITGRMGFNQHLARSIAAIRKDGGVLLKNGDRVLPEPTLLGRNLDRVRNVAEQFGIANYTDNYEEAMQSEATLFFDAGTTLMRPELLHRALDAGKNVYCEKPVGMKLDEVMQVVAKAEAAQLTTGVVQDKLFLPGLLKMKKLLDSGALGKLLSLRIEFGYWVFTGADTPAQRPSWNYKKAEGGSIIFDMLCHWRYVLDHVFGKAKSVSCLGVTHVPGRWDEHGNSYTADADDAAYATVLLENNVVAQINSSWCTRVNREDLVTFHADGTTGSAVSGLSTCKFQSLEQTPRPVWNPDEPQTMQFGSQWEPYGEELSFKNGFRQQWEDFIRALYGEPGWKFTLREGAKGVQLAEAAIQSWKSRKWIDLNPLP